MNPREIYEAYAADRRGLPFTGFRVEQLPHFTRSTASGKSGEGFINFTDLPRGQEEALIDEQIRYFDGLGQDFEWKVYDFDTPETLKSLLERRGFACDEEEAFLVMPTAAWCLGSPGPAGLRIEKITDDRGLNDIVAVQHALHHRRFGDWFDRYSEILRTRPNECAMFCAYLDDRPVGTGWVDFLPGKFCDLHGGAVLPEGRGRGIFSALLQARVAEARRREYAYVAVDTTRMSRPILLKKGFQHICYTYPLKRT